MYLAQWSKVGSVLLCLGVTVPGLRLLVQKGAALLPPAAVAAKGQAPPAADVPAMTVKPSKRSVTVFEKGWLEASSSADAYCLVEGQTTIIWIKPEGTRVKADELVCQLDSAVLRDQLVNQKIAVRSAEANYENAKLTREVAEIAVVEYEEGIYKSDLLTLKGEATGAESAIQKADARLVRTGLARSQMRAALAKKGAEKTPADLLAELDIDDRLDSAELTIARQRMALEHAKFKQKVLQEITKPRTMKELRADVERKRSDELAKRPTLALELAKERKLERQIAACEIKAPADGVIYFANAPARSDGRRPQIEEGAAVRERQKIFSVIDLTGPLLVITKVRESQVDKLAHNMHAKIRVDAFPDVTLDGTVLVIAPLPDPSNSHDLPDANYYTTKVKLDRRLPGLRPGMTAEVEIHVAERDNVLSVPVEAIVQYDGKDHVAVKKADGGYEWREVTLGITNEREVEVKLGLKPGEQVAIKPLDLLTEQQKQKLRSSPAQDATKRARPR